mmetsp:Transcript_13839/g.15271  ORF Transcript_13839/g.15271 Transcript_13839/m.15271 type:complete len:299 (+) Transcript_13839:46-942(+)
MKRKASEAFMECNDSVSEALESGKKQRKAEYSWPDFVTNAIINEAKRSTTSKPKFTLSEDLWYQYRHAKSVKNPQHNAKFHYTLVRYITQNVDPSDAAIILGEEIEEWDEDEKEEYLQYQWTDIDIIDGAGQVFPLRFNMNDGHADSNTGCWGAIRHRQTRELVCLVIDNQSDCTNVIYGVSDSSVFKAWQDFDDFPSDEEVKEHACLTNIYRFNHQFEKIVSVVLRDCTISEKFNEVCPTSWRVKMQERLLQLFFAREHQSLPTLPVDITKYIAKLAPACLPASILQSDDIPSHWKE